MISKREELKLLEDEAIVSAKLDTRESIPVQISLLVCDFKDLCLDHIDTKPPEILPLPFQKHVFKVHWTSPYSSVGFHPEKAQLQSMSIVALKR